MPAGLGFMVQAIFGITALSEGSLILIAACCVRSNCLLSLLVMSIVVLPHPILCPVVREWWAGADSMWERLVGLSMSSLEWALMPFD